MRLIIESGANCYYKNLLTSNKVIALILDKYINASYCDLVLIIYKRGYKRLQIYIINIIYIIYMPLYYILLFLYSNLSSYYNL
jgi:hypothetical protein